MNNIGLLHIGRQKGKQSGRYRIATKLLAIAHPKVLPVFHICIGRYM
jgi:hypothetical protein